MTPIVAGYREGMSYDEDREHDPAYEAVDEAGGGESEGFEQAEEALIENASHEADGGTTRILQDASDVDSELDDSGTYGDADEERSDVDADDDVS